MAITDKIRTLRELKHWSQEEMAEKMEMSKNSYARIERGESRLDLHKLEKIASVFEIDIIRLIDCPDERMMFLQFIGNNGNNTNYGEQPAHLISENEKLKLQLSHKEELLEAKDKEIGMLRDMLELLRNKE